MTIFDPTLPHGAQPVGAIRGACAMERRVVEALRLWLTGPEAQAEVWRAFSAEQGPEMGRAALHAFEVYLESVALGVRRKLWRHGVGCPCLGRDEAALAEAVAAAAREDRERAWAALAPLVAPAGLPRAVEAAGALAHALAAPPGLERAGRSAPRAAGFRRLH